MSQPARQMPQANIDLQATPQSQRALECIKHSRNLIQAIQIATMSGIGGEVKIIFRGDGTIKFVSPSVYLPGELEG